MTPLKSPSGQSSMATSPLSSQLTSAVRELTEAPKMIAGDLTEIIPDQVMRKYRIAVFGRAADGALQVAMASPQDVEALNVLRFLSERQGVAIEIYKASDEVFDKLLD